MKQGRSPKKHSPKHAAPLAGRFGLSERLVAEFADFVEYHSAKQFSKNLRKMLIEYLMHERSVESVYLQDLLYDIDGLFDLLDTIEAEDTTGLTAAERKQTRIK